MATTIISKNNNTAQSSTPKRGSIKLKEFLFVCLSNWYWFVISLVICLVLAYLHIQKQTPMYVQSAAMMIKSDGDGKSMSDNAVMFQDLGITNGNSKIEDEVAMLNSPDLMASVVRNLGLSTSYYVEGRFRNEELYGSTLPVNVEMPDLEETQSASYHLTLDGKGDYTITDLTLNGRPLNRGEIHGKIGTPISTPVGKVLVKPGKSYNDQLTTKILVSYSPVKAVAAALQGGLSTDENQFSDKIIEIKYVSNNPEKAHDIVDGVIAAYNARWMKDKSELADNSSKFIDQRIQLLQSELGSVDNDISSFKSANLVPDVDAAASMYMSQATASSNALRELRNQDYMTRYIRNYLRQSENAYKLLPSNSGLTNMSINSQIGAYNSKLLERNSLVAQSSTTNPLVTEMDNVLAAMRQALIASVDNEILAISEQIKSQEGASGLATSRIASNPRQAKYLLSVERQQKVKETLYLYLLQKREENQLNQALTSYNTRMIRETDGSYAPISPNKTNTYLIAFALGFAIPAGLLFLKEAAVSTIRGRKDIKNLKVPFAGELPFDGKKQKSFASAGRHKEASVVAVHENSRNAINEAFRVIRTNIEFMSGNDSRSRVIMLTSLNPGSGKTFITFNLAKSFSVKNKKVIILDLDMRKAHLSKYVDSTQYGIADYLANRVDSIDSITQNVPDTPNLSVIPVGTIPPNPTELLFSDRLHALIEDLRNHYDYIFIDCPPVEVVADSSIISKHADSTLFVIRAGLLRFEMLPVIEGYYEKNSYPNMSVILNGTINPTGRYARRYGNPYSYGYGYGSVYSYATDKK